jgi:hypothetical protein
MVGGATGVSVVLCVAAIVFWSRSGREHADVAESRRFLVVSNDCQLLIVRQDLGVGAHEDWRFYTLSFGWGNDTFCDYLRALANRRIRFLGFGLLLDYPPPSVRRFELFPYKWCVAIPFWFITLSTAILPAWRVIDWIRLRRRMLSGRCRACGYDLRATPERCPECGKKTEAELLEWFHGGRRKRAQIEQLDTARKRAG